MEFHDWEDIASRIEWIDKDHGIIRVRSEMREVEILEYRVRDTTPLLMDVANLVRKKVNEKLTYAKLFRRLCKKEVAPKINFTLSPLYFEEVKFHWGGLWFEGDIATRLDNKSEEGKIGITYVRRFRSCPEDLNAYKWQTVSGSADLTSSWLNKFWEDSQNIFISQLRQKANVKVGEFVEVKGHWKTDPLSVETFRTLLSIFTTGTIVTKHGFDVEYTYNFNGEHKEMRHVDLRVRLPIRGDIEWWNW